MEAGLTSWIAIAGHKESSPLQQKMPQGLHWTKHGLNEGEIIPYNTHTAGPSAQIWEDS